MGENMGRISLVGRVFGRLTVVAELDQRYMEGSVIWRCVCVCGNTKNVPNNKFSPLRRQRHFSMREMERFSNVFPRYGETAV